MVAELVALPLVPRVESLVAPDAVLPAPGRSDVEPAPAVAPPALLVELPLPVVEPVDVEPIPGVDPAPAPLRGVELPAPMPGVLLLVPALASVLPTISTRWPTYWERSRSPLSRYRMLVAPVVDVADPRVVPLVPVTPDEVDPVTPPERFPDAPAGIALASTKSLPSRAMQPVSVTC